MADFGRNFILVDGNMAQGTMTSRVLDTTGLQTFKIIAFWEDLSGSPIGTLSLQSSNNGITFTTILESEQSITDADGNFHIWDFPYNPFVLIRAKYVRSAGAGTMQMFAQFGG